MKKIIAVFVTVCLLCGNVTAISQKTVSAEYMSDDITVNFEAAQSEVKDVSALPEIAAKSAVLMERDTGKVLYKYNEHEKRAPASITKIMTLLLVMESIESGKLSLDTKVTASEHACSMGGSQIWLEPGEQMTVDELLRATVIASANDASVALAEAIGGSEEGFVDKMNLKAKQLGMNDTVFKNCSGLDDDGHLSSAYDIAVMSCELLRHKLIKNYTRVWMDSLRDGKSELVNTNKLIRFYEGATGLKTGTTSTAGFCVSGSAEKDGMELCAVVMGASNNDERFGTAKKLLNYGFANWELTEVKVPRKKLKPIKVEKGIEDTLPICAAGTGKYLLESGESDTVSLRMKLPKKVTAPISKNQKIGTAEVMNGGKKIGEIDIVAKGEVKKLTFKISFMRLFNAAITP